MFTFILNNSEKSSFNHPKYTIILKKLEIFYFHDNSVFYYLVSSNKNYTGIPCKFPTFLVIPSLYFNRNSKNDKFNLFNLGTYYVVNKICTHYRYECTDSYPDNYVFVNEPRWPDEGRITDRTPLKRSY